MDQKEDAAPWYEGGRYSARRRFWQGLGEFVDAFSMAELMTQLLLWKLSDVALPIAPALFSGVRLEQGVGFIRRVLEAKGRYAEVLVLKHFFDHLATLNKMRNSILHHGYELGDKDTATVSNALYVHLESRTQNHHVSLSDLKAMSSDVRYIAAAFGGVVFREVSILALEREPWLYKQPPQASQHRKNPRTGPRRQRPPSSSRH